MEPALSLPKMNLFQIDEDPLYQNSLDRLNLKKMTWEQFLKKVKSPLSVARLASSTNGRTLLHLAVLDRRLDIIRALKAESSLKSRRDLYGLSPFELAQFLNFKEALDDLALSVEPTLLPSFPHLQNFEYLTHPVFETKEALEHVLGWTAKEKKEDKIPAEKIWMGIYFDKEIRKGSHPPITLRWIDEKMGFGVFAEKNIPACTYMGEYTGVIQEISPKQLKDKRYCLRYMDWSGKKHLTINAENQGNFTRFINHSSTPNLGLQSVYWRGLPRMIFVALKEIREGRQLTFDYGPLFWKEMKENPIEIQDD